MHMAKERLDDAVTQWTLTTLLREMTADPAAPKILWDFADTPRTWFGHTFPGGALGGDNPDHIYRTVFIDGAAQYEITGKMSRVPPVLFSFEANFNQPNMKFGRPVKTEADIGNQFTILTNKDLKVEPDGTFRIQVGGEKPADGGNYLATAPAMMEITIRDVFSDWNQRPLHLGIRRVSPPVTEAPWDDAEIVRRTAADLSDFVRFWLDANIRWVKPVAVNALLPPAGRDGGWGYLSGGQFKLADDEAMVVTVDPKGARYMGFQIADPWMIVPDSRVHQTSLNNTQAAYNPDGTITYVIAVKDPGVANWIDTGGPHEGFSTIRWQVLPEGVTKDGLIRRAEVMKVEKVRAQNLGGPLLSKKQRKAQLAQRAIDYDKRLSD
jgi:hypothetical protein